MKPPASLGQRLEAVDTPALILDWYVCVRGGAVEALWPITARGAGY